MATEQHVSDPDPAYAQSESQTGYGGVWLTIGDNDILLNSVTKSSVCGGTTAYIGTSAQGSQVGSQAFSGNTATFGSPLTLSANTTYYITAGSGGSSYNYTWDKPATWDDPAGGEFTWRGRVDWAGGTAEDNYANAYISINFSTIQTDVTPTPSALTLSFTSGSPVYLITIPKPALAMTMTLNSPTLSVVDYDDSSDLPAGFSRTFRSSYGRKHKAGLPSSIRVAR